MILYGRNNIFKNIEVCNSSVSFFFQITLFISQILLLQLHCLEINIVLYSSLEKKTDFKVIDHGDIIFV